MTKTANFVERASMILVQVLVIASLCAAELDVDGSAALKRHTNDATTRAFEKNSPSSREFESFLPEKAFFHAFQSTTGLFMGAIDAATGAIETSLEGVKSFMDGYAYSPMQMLPVTNEDHSSSLHAIRVSDSQGNGTMTLVQAASRKVLWETPLHCASNPIFVTVNPFEQSVHVECNESMLELDAHTGQLRRSVPMKHFTDLTASDNDVYFHSNPASGGETWLVMKTPRDIRIHRYSDYLLLRSIPITFFGAKLHYRAAVLDRGVDGKGEVFVADFFSNTVTVYSVETGQQLRHFSTRVDPLRIALIHPPHLPPRLMVSRREVVEIYDAWTGELLLSDLPPLPPTQSAVEIRGNAEPTAATAAATASNN